MVKQRREYIVGWLVLGIFLASSLVVGFLILFSKPSDLTRMICLFLLATIISLGLYFFYKASGLLMLKDKLDKEQSKEISRPNLTEKKKDQISEILDIQSLSDKIIRRIDFGQEPTAWAPLLLNKFVTELEIMSGIIYKKNKKDIYEPLATYAYPHATEAYGFNEGEGLNGQVAKNKQAVVLTSLPEEYTRVFSGLGSAIPSYLGIAPVIINDSCDYIIEIAGFRWADQRLDQLLQLLCKTLSQKLSVKTE